MTQAGKSSARTGEDVCGLGYGRDMAETPIKVIGARNDGIFTVVEQRGLGASYGVEAEILDGGHDLMLDTSWPTLVDTLDEVASHH